MPFDSTTWDKAIIDDLHLDQPSIKALSHILRNRNLWPQGFKWDYDHCSSCAMGLAARLWSKHIRIGGEWEIKSNARIVGKAIALPHAIAKVVFTELFNHKNTPAPQISPNDVADWLDSWLAGTFPFSEAES
jgi:hypothetical protein